MDDNKGKQDDNTSAKPDSTSETYTKEQVDKLLANIRSDALSDVGRVKKEAELHAENARKALERVDKLIKEQETLEIEVAGGDEDILKQLKTKQSLRTKEAELAKVREELDIAKSQLAEKVKGEVELRREQTARRIAAERGIDPNKLVKLAKFTDGSTEAIEELAQDLPKVQGDIKQQLKPDSNVSHGGGKGKKPSLEEIRAVSPEVFDAKVKSGEWTIW